MSDQKQITMDTQHTDSLHDLQFDYYGTKLATCSSDHTVKVFSVPDQVLLDTLCGHQGPVWAVAWAHPRFGDLLATASYDTRAIVWKKQQDSSKYTPTHAVQHGASVNSVAWGPQEFGAVLATASSDGTVRIVSFRDGMWPEVKLGSAHPMGSMAVSFCPFVSFNEGPVLASGGCDCSLRLWSLREGQWVALRAAFTEHTDWVRDVAFSPDITLGIVLASCAQDKTVIVRRRDVSKLTTTGAWETSTTVLPTAVWRLSWSSCGTQLVATTADSEAFLLERSALFTDPWKVSPLRELAQ